MTAPRDTRPQHGSLLAVETYPVDSRSDAVDINPDTLASRSAAAWRRAGHSARIYKRLVRAGGVEILCHVVVVRSKDGAR